MKDSCVHPVISSQLSVFLFSLFHIKDWGYKPTPCSLSRHCDSLCSRMMVYKWMVHIKVKQIHRYLFCHKSRPVLGEMHMDHQHGFFSSLLPKWSSVYFIKSWYWQFHLSCKDIIIGCKVLLAHSQGIIKKCNQKGFDIKNRNSSNRSICKGHWMYCWLEKNQLIVLCEQLEKLLSWQYLQRCIIHVIIDGMCLDTSNDFIKHVQIISSMCIHLWQ